MTTLSTPPLPPALVTWLSKLTLLHGVPFTSLVPDPRLLPPESIKFFQLDPSWVGALVDGALSIGRHFTGTGGVSPRLVGEQMDRPRIGAAVQHEAPAIRRRQLRGSAATTTAPVDVVTGVLLRSTVVSGWKSLDVIGYAAGSSPYDAERRSIAPDQVQALEILRLERLSPTVLFGLFHGQVFQLVVHQPPEAVHFGFAAQNPATNTATKNLRVPATSWDDPAATYDSQGHQHQQLDGVFADAARRVVDLSRLSRALAATLASVDAAPGYYQPAPDPNHKDHLVSSDFALEMVQGVGLVSFLNHPLPAPAPR
jgi:hypothetical protein